MSLCGFQICGARWRTCPAEHLGRGTIQAAATCPRQGQTWRRRGKEKSARKDALKSWSAFGAVDGNDHLAADSLESNVDPGVTRCEHGSEGVGPQFLKPGAVFVCLVLVHSEIGAGLVIQPLLKHTAQVRDLLLTKLPGRRRNRQRFQIGFRAVGRKACPIVQGQRIAHECKHSLVGTASVTHVDA